MSSPDHPAPAAKARLQWVDAGRGIAITLVALFHATNWLLGAGADVHAWDEANVVMSSLRMPLFFTLAGLFAGKWVRGAWGPLWRHKLRLYLWVFLLWGAIGSLTYFMGVRMRGAGSVTSSVVEPYLLSLVMPRLELWFIWALALFFVVAKLTSRVPPWLQLSVAGVLSAVALSGWVTASPGWNGSVKYYAFFLTGLYGREVVIRYGSTNRRALLAGAFALWAVVAVGLWALDLREVLGLYFLNCVVGVAGGIALSRALAGWSALRSLGSRTLPVYLAHTPIIIVVSVVLSLTPVVDLAVVSVVGPPLLAVGAVAAALLLERGAVRVGAGWLYTPPAWFDLPQHPGAPVEVPARPAAAREPAAAPAASDAP